MNEELIVIDNEINALTQWFNWYDTQTVQYARDLRIKGNSEIDLSKLDLEAIEKASRVKELRKQREQVVKDYWSKYER